MILPPGNSEGDCEQELSPPILYSSLVLGLKACITTAQFLWQTSVATEIKGVCHHCLVCKTDQGNCFYSLNVRQALFIKIQTRAGEMAQRLRVLPAL